MRDELTNLRFASRLLISPKLSWKSTTNPVYKLKSKWQSPAYQLIISIAKRNWRLLAANLATNLCSALLEGSTLGVVYLAIAFLSGDDVPEQLTWLSAQTSFEKEEIFLALLAVAVILQVLLSLSNYLNKVSTAYFSASVQPQVTGKVFERIMSFSFGCASRYKVGDLVNFVSTSASTVNLQVTTTNNLIVSLTFAITYSLVLVTLSPSLALAAIVLAGLTILIQRWLVPKIISIAKQLMLVRVDADKFMTESIQGLRLIHTFGAQQRTIDRSISILEELKTKLKARALLVYIPESILEILPIFALATLAGFAYSFNSSTESVLPTLLTFLIGLQRLATRLKGIASTSTKLADNTAALQRLNTILLTADKQFYSAEGEVFTKLTENIQFEGVSLSYDGKEPFALNDLDMTIPLNQVTALVGQSGAGKSSIVDLLLGLYQPTKGRVVINEKNLQQYVPYSWQDRVGVVSQDTFIFNCSILDNLRYGALNATVEEVIAAAKDAQAHQFILDLPEGYDTIVGERGYRLSGGQRQRLAMARAILKQPEVLILDEATSALDSQSEQLIQEALDRFQENRTVVVIAHRLSTIVNADQILVLDRGRVVESGTHRQLLRNRGQYAYYWDLQTQKATV